MNQFMPATSINTDSAMKSKGKIWKKIFTQDYFLLKIFFFFFKYTKNKLSTRAKAPAWAGMNGTEMQLYPLIPQACALFHQKHLSDTYTIPLPQTLVTK